jgi:hypothetical protein
MAVSIPLAGSVAESTLKALEARFGGLPREYVDFLTRHDGAKPPSNVLEGSDNGAAVSAFLPAIEIIDRADSVEGLPSYLLPFGEDDSGNFLCLNLDDDMAYFWDHELEGEKVIAANFEPRRVCRRRWVVSHAAISRLLAAA